MLWYHLVSRSSYCLGQWVSGKWRTMVPGTPGMRGSSLGPQGKAGETVNLEADFARAAYKRQSATLGGNYQLGRERLGHPQVT